MEYNYTDKYLLNGGSLTDDRELQAKNAVLKSGITDLYYVEKLTILNHYIVACMADMTTKDDAYTIRLTAYKEQYNTLYIEALQNKNTTNATCLVSGTIGRA